MTTFNFGNGPVSAHRHSNGGGWVANTATVADTAYIGPDACVFGNAMVYGNAQVCGNALVYGNALVCDNAQVSGTARVCGNARVYGDAQVYGNALVSGNAQVCDKVCVMTGVAGDHGWTAYREASGRIVLQYGCETHALSDWQHEELSVKHTGSVEHAKITLAIAALAALLLELPSEP